MLQGVGRDPCFDGCAAPAVDDDALWHLCLLLHALAEEIADGGEEPGVLFVQGFPVDGCRLDVISDAMGIGLVLHAKQADVGIFVRVNLLGVLRIDAFDGDVDIRLS